MRYGRFAPSPTGELHLGNLRTALLSWLWARTTGHEYLVRIDDLDQQRVVVGSAEQQLTDLAALGLTWSSEVVFQSQRLARYERAIDTLDTAGLTYRCYCTRREIREAASAPQAGEQSALPDGAYPGTCRELSVAEADEREASGRPPALRLRSMVDELEIADQFVGRYVGVVDDLVLRRNDGTPAYNLAVVVDDAEQLVSQVVRGDDLLSSTPRQVYLAGLLELSVPEYVHVPLALNQAGQRLAKRDGAVTLAALAAQGIGPEQVLSRLAESLQLAAPGEPVTVELLRERFNPHLLPREPWVVAG